MLCAEEIELNFNANQNLKSIRHKVIGKSDIFQINGFFKFTKTKRNYAEALLHRDKELEIDVQRWIKDRSSFHSLIIKYKNYDHNIPSTDWPKHYPIRILSGGGSICSSDNIFMFFPEALGLSTGKEEDYFGFEFIDVWSNIINSSVFPCVKKSFSCETQLNIATGLRCRLDKTIYLASVFHEVGHRVGPWKVSPQKNPGLQINDFHTDILGELATDSLLVSQLVEFPEIAQFVFFQRIFWFTRRGFRNNPISALINEDNDSWIGAYLWDKFIKLGLLKFSKNKWEINNTNILIGFNEILKDIDKLGNEVLNTSITEQDRVIHDWMKKQITFHQGLGFVLSESLSEIFWQCQEINEIPHFQPQVNLNKGNHL